MKHKIKRRRSRYIDTLCARLLSLEFLRRVYLETHATQTEMEKRMHTHSHRTKFIWESDNSNMRYVRITNLHTMNAVTWSLCWDGFYGMSSFHFIAVDSYSFLCSTIKFTSRGHDSFRIIIKPIQFYLIYDFHMHFPFRTAIIHNIYIYIFKW